MRVLHGLPAIILVILGIFLSGCYNDGFEPYLILDVKDEYDSGTVEIGYSFLSEREEQACRVLLSMAGMEDYVYSNDDDRLPDSGTLQFTDLAAGTYTLYFAVLSERGREPTVIPFLEETYNFLVR